MILFNTDQSKLRDKLASLAIKDIVTNSKLLKIVPGPDFPTGGEIVDSSQSIKEAYSKGKGTIRLRAKWKQESLGRGQYLKYTKPAIEILVTLDLYDSRWPFLSKPFLDKLFKGTN